MHCWKHINNLGITSVLDSWKCKNQLKNNQSIYSFLIKKLIFFIGGIIKCPINDTVITRIYHCGISYNSFSLQICDWKHINKCLTAARNIKALASEDRIWHRPEKAKWLYWEFTKVKDVISQDYACAIADCEMTHKEFIDALVMLRDNELVID